MLFRTLGLQASSLDSTHISLIVQVIVSTACKTAGEALREIDMKDIIKSDFVLVSGDVVSNMDLGAALESHKARRDKDKNALMTMVSALSWLWHALPESLLS